MGGYSGDRPRRTIMTAYPESHSGASTGAMGGKMDSLDNRLVTGATTQIAALLE